MTRPRSFVPRSCRHTAAIDCRVIAVRDERLIARRIENLSRSGLRVRQEACIAIGEAVDVYFRDPRWRLRVAGRGVVSRLIEGRRTTDRGPAFGIAFRELDGFSDYLLAHTLWGLPLPEPER